MSEDNNAVGLDVADYVPQPGDEPYLSEVPEVNAVRKISPADVKIDKDSVTAVAVLAKGLGLTGGSFEDMALTWLRPLTDGGWGTTRSGVMRAKSAVKLLSLVLDGMNPTKALEQTGLTRKELTAFRYVCPEFGKMYRTAVAARREAIGDDVLDTAYEAATKGLEVTVRNKDGVAVGTDIVKNERMMDRLLALSGPEFQKGTALAVAAMNGGGGGSGPAVVMNFHFDRKGMEEAKEAKEAKGEVIDV